MVNNDKLLFDEKIRFVTPAHPGFYVLSPRFDEAGAFCGESLEPIIAWALDGMGSTWPVTVYELQNQGADPTILCPDGQVFNFNSEWDDIHDWREEQKAKVRHG